MAPMITLLFMTFSHSRLSRMQRHMPPETGIEKWIAAQKPCLLWFLPIFTPIWQASAENRI